MVGVWVRVRVRERVRVRVRRRGGGLFSHTRAHARQGRQACTLII